MKNFFLLAEKSFLGNKSLFKVINFGPTLASGQTKLSKASSKLMFNLGDTSWREFWCSILYTRIFLRLDTVTFCTNRDKGPDKLDLVGSKKLHFYAKEQDVNLC